MAYFIIGVILGFLSAFHLIKSFCKKTPNFINKTVLVTGASSGIGEYVCYELSRLGANVILCSRRLEQLKRVQSKLAFPEKSSIFVLDMKNPQKVQRETETLLDDFEQRTGFQKLDILVLNAGIVQRQELEHTKLEVFDEVMRVNFNSCVTMTRAVLPYFGEHKSGQIVATSSILGLHSNPLRTAYSSSKHALNGFLNSLRPEVAQSNIHITLVCPGVIATNVSINSLMGDGSLFGKDVMSHGMPSAQCAKQFVEAIYNKEIQRVVGSRTEKVRVMLSRLSSDIEAWYGTRRYKKN